MIKCQNSNESLRININDKMSKFKDVIEEPKITIFGRSWFHKKWYLISSGNDVLAENSEHLIKQLQENITFLREQLKNKDEVIRSLLQQ